MNSPRWEPSSTTCRCSSPIVWTTLSTSRLVRDGCTLTIVAGGPPQSLITVCKEACSFNKADHELLRPLARREARAGNVNPQFDVQRKAISNDLTGLATHGPFQRPLAAEMDEVRRYNYPAA